MPAKARRIGHAHQRIMLASLGNAGHAAASPCQRLAARARWARRMAPGRELVGTAPAQTAPLGVPHADVVQGGRTLSTLDRGRRGPSCNRAHAGQGPNFDSVRISSTCSCAPAVASVRWRTAGRPRRTPPARPRPTAMIGRSRRRPTGWRSGCSGRRCRMAGGCCSMAASMAASSSSKSGRQRHADEFQALQLRRPSRT